MLKDKRIGFLGAGNMAEAMIHGLIESGSVNAAKICVSDRNIERLNVVVEGYGIEGCSENFEAARRSDIVVLAVKPQVVAEVLDDIRDELNGERLLVSIAAGVPIERIAAHLNEGAKIVRVMPNTPALVLSGISVLCPGAGVDEEEVGVVESLFKAVGETVTVGDEGLMDAVTGLSGSGPAFVYTFIEALSDAGVRAGLPRDVASLLARQTVFGAAKAVKELNRHPAELRDMVTSPGGTTIAGMERLEDKGFRAAVMAAVGAAAERSKELGEKQGG